MNGMIRALSTLAGVAAAGFLLWVAAQVGRHSTGGYWAAYAIVAAAGLVLALSQLRGRTGHPRAMFTFGFLPVLVVAGWVLIAMEPHGNWFRDHVARLVGRPGDRQRRARRRHLDRRARARDRLHARRDARADAAPPRRRDARAAAVADGAGRDEAREAATTTTDGADDDRRTAPVP